MCSFIWVLYFTDLELVTKKCVSGYLVTLVYIADQKLEVTIHVWGASVDLSRVGRGATVSKCSFRQTVESVVQGFQHVCFDSPKEECWTWFFFLSSFIEREPGFQRWQELGCSCWREVERLINGTFAKRNILEISTTLQTYSIYHYSSRVSKPSEPPVVLIKEKWTLLGTKEELLYVVTKWLYSSDLRT